MGQGLWVRAVRGVAGRLMVARAMLHRPPVTGGGSSPWPPKPPPSRARGMVVAAQEGFRPAPPANALCLLLAAIAAHTIEAGHTKIKT